MAALRTTDAYLWKEAVEVTYRFRIVVPACFITSGPETVVWTRRLAEFQIDETDPKHTD